MKVDEYNLQLKIDLTKMTLEEDKTIGFSTGIWSNDIQDWCPYNYKKERRVENAGVYLRIDRKGNILDD